MSGNMDGVEAPLGPAVPETVTLTNEHFPHLSSYEWLALERMRDVIGKVAVISLLRSTSPEGNSQLYAPRDHVLPKAGCNPCSLN